MPPRRARVSAASSEASTSSAAARAAAATRESISTVPKRPTRSVRASFVQEDADEVEEEMETKLRGRKTATRKQAVVESDEDEQSEAEESIPVKSAGEGSRKAAKMVKKELPSEENEEDSQESDQEVIKPKKRVSNGSRRAAHSKAVSTGKAAVLKKAVPASKTQVDRPVEQQNSDENDDSAVTNSLLGGNNVLNMEDSSNGSHPPQASEYAEEDLKMPPSGQSRSELSQSSKDASDHEKEEASSLASSPGPTTPPAVEVASRLDPSSPAKANVLNSPMVSKALPAKILPIHDGPKKRLVIHKLALVDFKSYAGRQEIGPFHKV